MHTLRPSRTNPGQSPIRMPTGGHLGENGSGYSIIRDSHVPVLPVRAIGEIANFVLLLSAVDKQTPALGMFGGGVIKTWALICAQGVLLSGCHRSPVGQAPLTGAPPVAAVALSQVDLGASLLAEVDNARFAIELRDLVAAANDVGHALAFARQLPDRSSKLLLSEPLTIEPAHPSSVSGAAVLHARLTAFAALVKLGSAQAELESNLEAADADLHAIQMGIPEGLIPSDLPLLRAAASLDAARSAVAEGRIPQLRTQLLTAQLALSVYAGPGHVAEAKEMAATIGKRLTQANNLGTIPSDQASLWLGKVVEWAGSDRWSAVAAGP